MPEQPNNHNKIASLETALQESEERLRFVLQGSQQGFWDWDLRTGAVQRNARWAELLGYTFEEIQPFIGQWTELMHPDDRQRARQAIEDHIEGRLEQYRNEYRMRAKDGSYKWILDHASIVQRDKKGRPLRMCGTHTDITERKQMEEALRESEHRFRTISENSLAGIYIIQDWRIKYANPVLCQIFGMPEEKLVGLNPLVFVHPEDRSLVQENMRQQYAGEVKTSHYEYRCQRNNGKIIHVEVLGSMIEYYGRPALLGNLVDVTERKQIQEELEKEREIFRLFMQYSPIYVFIKDENIRAIQLSKNYENMLGKPVSQLLGKQMAELFPTELARSMEACDQYILEKGNPIKVVETLDGRIYETVKFPIIRPGQPSYLAGFTTDITERQKAEDALQQANWQLKVQLKEIKLLQEQLREQAIRDPLTGLFNRRYLQETLDREIARASREKQPVGLIIMDIDNFKRINDAYGHRAGDKMLNEFGDLLTTSIRAEDIPCRYGGEEFVIVMPGASLQTAFERAEQIRQKFDSLHVRYQQQDLHATISLGVAAYPTNGQNSEAVLIRADRALYRAKQSGRNRVVAYQDTAHMPPPKG
jgi:diguanylate cyclase (GGDEF)-like protein/PAS domain S-box-containing protein